MHPHHTGLLLLFYDIPYIFYLLSYRIRARTAGRIPFLHAGPQIQSPVDILLYEIGEHPELIKRQIFESTSPSKTIRHYLS